MARKIAEASKAVYKFYNAKPVGSRRRLPGGTVLAGIIKCGFDIVDTAAFRPSGGAPAPAGTARRSGRPKCGVTAEIASHKGRVFAACLVHPNGGITWHYPDKNAGTGHRHLFVIDTYPAAAASNEIRRMRKRTGTRSPGTYTLFILSAVLASRAAKKGLAFLAGKWEEKRIKHAFFRFAGSRIDTSHPLRSLPHHNGRRGLLFLHGTFSSTTAVFGSLYKNHGNIFINTLRRYYENRIIGFDHPTISLTPDDNARWLLDHMQTGAPCLYDIIAHSRGGLVARTLAEKARGRGNLVIDRVVLVAAPNLGSPLVPNAGDKSDRPYERFAVWLTNVAYLLPGNALPWVTRFLAEFIKCIAAEISGIMPGIEAFAEGSAFLKKLNAVSPIGGTVYHAVGSNFEAPKNLLLKLADAGADRLFHDDDNDLTVSTRSAVNIEDYIPALRKAVFSPYAVDSSLKANIHHFNYFKTSKCLNVISHFLGLPKDAARGISKSRRSKPKLKLIGSASARGLPPMAAEAPGFPPGMTRLDVLIVGDRKREEEQRRWIKRWKRQLALAGVTGLPPEPFPFISVSSGMSRTAAVFKTRGADTYWHSLIGTERSLRRYLEDAGPELSLERLQRAGIMLMQTIFQRDARLLLERALAENEDQAPVLISLTSTNPWIADFPWEMLFDSKRKRFLSLGDVVFFRGVISTQAAISMPVLPIVIRMVIAVAQPSDQIELEWESEVEGLLDALRPLIKSKRLYIEVLKHTSMRSLREQLRKTRCHILHYIGHADYDEASDTGNLIFENPRSGRSEPVSAQSICKLLIQEAPLLRLVLLNGCETAEGGRADFNLGVAPALVAAGVPGVVGNRLLVGDRAAISFAKTFYEELSSRKSLAEAALAARRELASSPNLEPFEWAVPIIFAIDPEAKFF